MQPAVHPDEIDKAGTRIRRDAQRGRQDCPPSRPGSRKQVLYLCRPHRSGDTVNEHGIRGQNIWPGFLVARGGYAFIHNAVIHEQVLNPTQHSEIKSTINLQVGGDSNSGASWHH